MCFKRAATVKKILLGGTETFEFKPVKGRYVNIFLPGHGKYLTLCEVEVFAGERYKEREGGFVFARELCRY